MVSPAHPLALVITHQAAATGFARAAALDVERGGIYDARSAAINVWSHPWTSPEDLAASEIVGTIYVEWRTPRPGLATLRRLDVDQERYRALLWRSIRALFDLPLRELPGVEDGAALT